MLNDLPSADPQPGASLYVTVNISPEEMARRGMTQDDISLAIRAEAAAKQAGRELPDCTPVIDAVLRYAAAIRSLGAH